MAPLLPAGQFLVLSLCQAGTSSSLIAPKGLGRCAMPNA